MSDTIDRQAAIEIVDRYDKSHMILKGKPMLGAASIVIELEALPSAQPLIIHCTDCEDWHERQSIFGFAISELPTTHAEPLSDAYMKAVWTWLLDYQIKVAELKGRYTPYEVLSWVANDWRKEHERFNKQAGGD